MVVNFPVTDVTDPNYSHTHTEPNGVTWTWDGEKWRVTNNSSDGGGGAPSDINLQEVTDNGAITDNIIDFQSGAIVSGGQLQLPGGGNDTDALQRQEVVSLINSNQTVTDGRYLRLDVDAAAQSVESTAGVSYKGLTTHEAGVDVTGGMGARSISTIQSANWGGNQAAKFYATGGSDTIGSQGFTAQNIAAGSDNTAMWFHAKVDSSTDIAGVTNYAFHTNAVVGSNATNYSFYAEGSAPSFFHGLTEHAGGVDVTGGNATVSGNNIFYSKGAADRDNEYPAFLVRPNDTVTPRASNYIGFRSQHLNTTTYNISNQAIHFLADGSGITDLAPINNFGFYSALAAGSNNNFNFYAPNTAPNYFAGGVQFDIATGTTPLEDYEEGTWSLLYDNDVLDGFTAQDSFYRIIGKTVVYSVRLGGAGGSNVLLASGTYNITNFPLDTSTIGSNCGTTVIFTGANNVLRGEATATFTITGGQQQLRFVLDSDIANVRMIRASFVTSLI